MPGDQPGLGAPRRADARAGVGTYVFRADANDAAGNTASTTLRADGTRWRSAGCRRRAPAAAPRAKSRLFARLRGGHGAASADRPVRRRRRCSAAGSPRADGAGLGGRELRVVSRPSRGALTSAARRRRRDRRAGRLRAAAAARPVAPAHRRLRRRRRVGARHPPAAGAAGPRRGHPPRRAARLRTGQTVRLSGRVKSRGAPIPRRGKLVAIQYLEEATRPLAAGAGHPQRPPGPLPRPLPLPLRQRPAAIRLRATALAEERWPYVPGPRRRSRSGSGLTRSARVSGHVASDPSHQRRGDRARASRRGRAENRRELPQALCGRVLRPARLPPGHPGLHDPGRLPGGHRRAAVPATPSRTSSTTTRSSAERWRWPTPAPTPTAPSSSSSPPAPRPGSTASTPSSAR